jgi:RimJ/RimL family protein N-acetyltransferase
VTLRPATEQDRDLLLSWRNDNGTRSAALCSAPVLDDEHDRWLKASLSSATRRIYVAEDQGVPVGTLRTDQREDGIELSWTVAPEARGRGLGKRIVEAGLCTVSGRVFAQIRIENSASKAIARSLGFEQLASRAGISYWAVTK